MSTSAAARRARAEHARLHNKARLHAQSVFVRLCTPSEALELAEQAAEQAAEQEIERIVSAFALFARTKAISSNSRFERAYSGGVAAAPDAGEQRILACLAEDAATCA